MSSLYRKYRPNQFSQIIGQDHIRSSIEGMLKSGAIGHAYLFSGPRGTGKTTLARLLARAINCTGKKTDVEACGKCEICLEIVNGQSVDIIEIDAASNRGIDEIRDLREKIAFAPARAKYKVYIIDEVHMLTKEAFNALLKTLEEPPKHVVFILATTELHKVPETIISRCQRYQFHRASTASLVEVLLDVAKKEGIKLAGEAAGILAERAEGSYRDALTMLGNVASAPQLDAQTLRELIGLPPAETIEAVLGSIKTANPTELARTLQKFINAGGDMAVLTRTLANSSREYIFNLSNPAELPFFSGLLEELLVALVKARHSVDATSLLAATLIKMAASRQPPTNKLADPALSTNDLDDIKEREPASTPAVDAVSATPAPAVESSQFWPNFLEAVKEKNHALYAVVRSAQFEGVTDDKLIIAVKFRFYSERLFEPKNRTLIESIAQAVAGRQLTLECLVKTDLDGNVSKEEDLLSAVVEVFEINE